VKTEQHAITSADRRYTRDVWLSRSLAEGPHRLAVFLDAEHYLRDMDSLPVIKDLIGTGALPPTTCVFVSHVSGAARHEDYTCNDEYSRFITEDVVAWAKEQDDQIGFQDNLICGLSLSGLAGAYIASHAPGVFSRALCQSGSFWWLADHPVPMPATRGRFWLSVGSEETAVGVSHPPTGLFQRVSQVEGVWAAAERLAAQGATVHLTVFPGGHAPAPWRADLPPALTWLASEEPPNIEREPTRAGS
jgi:enterochelin esterase family protein